MKRKSVRKKIGQKQNQKQTNNQNVNVSVKLEQPKPKRTNKSKRVSLPTTSKKPTMNIGNSPYSNVPYWTTPSVYDPRITNIQNMLESISKGSMKVHQHNASNPVLKKEREDDSYSSSSIPSTYFSFENVDDLKKYGEKFLSEKTDLPRNNTFIEDYISDLRSDLDNLDSFSSPLPSDNLSYLPSLKLSERPSELPPLPSQIPSVSEDETTDFGRTDGTIFPSTFKAFSKQRQKEYLDEFGVDYDENASKDELYYNYQQAYKSFRKIKI